MCGLFGFCGTIPQQQRQTLARALAVFNVERGEHATGVVGFNHRRKARSYKRCESPLGACTRPAFSRVVDHADTVLIGHTRYASVGDVSHANAHPFNVGDVWGAHNGTIRNVDALRSHTGKEYGTDSQHLVHMLAHEGSVTVPIDGTAALTYVATKDAADVCLSRWDMPLAVAEVHAEGVHAAVWSSEWLHLEGAIAIAGWSDVCDIALDNYEELRVYLDANGRLDDFQWGAAPINPASSKRNSVATTATGTIPEATEDDEDWLELVDDDADADYWRMIQDGAFRSDSTYHGEYEE